MDTFTGEHAGLSAVPTTEFHMTTSFGKIMPLHGYMLNLAGLHVGRSRRQPESDDLEIMKRMVGGYNSLVRTTGQDFGFDLARWQEFLTKDAPRDIQQHYRHPYGYAGTRAHVENAIHDPTRIRLAAILDQNEDLSQIEASAEKDWETGHARVLRIGKPSPTAPVLDPETGLLQKFMGEPIETPEDLAGKIRRIRKYNAIIRNKLQANGPPDWLPSLRIPAPDVLLKNFAENMRLIQAKESLPPLVEARIKAWNEFSRWPALAYSLDESAGVTFVGGDNRARSGRIDVIDTKTGDFLTFREYPHGMYRDLPWKESKT